MPIQSRRSSSASSSSELRTVPEHQSAAADQDPVLTEEDDEADTVNYGSSEETIDYTEEDEELNHWVAFTENCRSGPTLLPWWKSDILFLGINSFENKACQSSTVSPSLDQQSYFPGIEMELHHSLAKWLLNQVYVSNDETLVYRITEQSVSTGIERDCDE